MGRVPKSRGEKTSLVAAIGLDEGVSDAMTSTGAVAGVAFLAYLEHPLAPRPRPGQIVVLDRLGGAPQTGGAGGDRSAGVRVGAVAWVRPGLQPQRVGFQQDRGVRESCGGEDEGERWTLRSRLRWGRCRWGMWWVGLSMPESRITHCENRCKRRYRHRGERPRGWWGAGMSGRGSTQRSSQIPGVTSVGTSQPWMGSAARCLCSAWGSASVVG